MLSAAEISGEADRARIWTGLPADHMGMLATAINALALQDALRTERGADKGADGAYNHARGGALYSPARRCDIWKKGRVVIFGCGTGNPYFSTDTTAALRAAEIHAEILLCAKNIDGIYDFDPQIGAKRQKI